MLLVICNIIGKIHLFQLHNLNHTFSPTYLYIYHINHLREKSHQAQRSFCVCVCVFLEKISYLRKNIIARQFSCVPFKSFSENSHRHYLTSDISILSFNLFKKIVLASQSQSKPPNGQKGFFTLLESFFYRSKKYSQRLYFNHIMLINICKAQTLFKYCSLIYLENFVSIHLGRFYS